MGCDSKSDSANSIDRGILIVYFVILIVCGSYGNLCVIYGIVFSKANRTRPSNVFNLGLAFCDLLTCLFVGSFELSSLLKDGHLDGDAVSTCKGALFITYYLQGVSILSLASICVDRYIALRFPYKYSASVTTIVASSAVAILWAESFVAFLPIALINGWASYENMTGIACGVVWKNLHSGYVFFIGFFNMFLPAIAVIVSNCIVFSIARKHNRKLFRLKLQFYSNPSNLTEIDEKKGDINGTRITTGDRKMLVETFVSEKSNVLENERICLEVEGQEADVSCVLDDKSVSLEKSLQADTSDRVPVNDNYHLKKRSNQVLPYHLVPKPNTFSRSLSPLKVNFTHSLESIGEEEEGACQEHFAEIREKGSIEVQCCTQNTSEGCAGNRHEHNPCFRNKIFSIQPAANWINSKLKVRPSVSKKQMDSSFNNVGSDVFTTPKRPKMAKRQSPRGPSEWKIASSTLLIAFCFLIAYFPWVVARLVLLFTKPCYKAIVYTTSFALSSGLWNPFIILFTRFEIRNVAKKRRIFF
ncbi:uncharacterized protein LOC135695991 [Rhopilema esculentum]|uniref:uncharacterized protein LOC135695991 n=1 Tax=Rhopilema esculentum TaxID=499914 RepID=UPI0031E2D744